MEWSDTWLTSLCDGLYDEMKSYTPEQYILGFRVQVVSILVFLKLPKQNPKLLEAPWSL